MQHLFNNKFINVILLFLWMTFIFMMSHCNAEVSSSQSSTIVGLINNITNTSNPDILTTLVRKSAHFFEYLILGILTINVIKDYVNIKNYKKLILFSIIICIIYAFSDEVHQIYVPGRDGNVVDCLIDSFGSLSGILIYYLFYKKLINKQNN